MAKIGVIIQARMGSTRLPGKIMKKLSNKTVLSHVIERVKQIDSINKIVIATTNVKKDDIIVKEAKSNDIKYFRGSESDVLSRYYNAAIEFKTDVIVRITSDCPLIDPNVSENVINYYLNNNYALVTNAGIYKEKRTYPRGFDTEVFSFEALEEAYKNAKKEFQREHVTPYIYKNYNNIYFYKSDIDNSKYRLTLDTPEDFKLINKIYDMLYDGVHNFYYKEIMDLFDKNPELMEINNSIKQKSIKD